MPEVEDELVEIYAWENGRRHRVYRGSNPDHIQWKLDHHAKRRPELVHVKPADPPPATSSPA